MGTGKFDGFARLRSKMASIVPMPYRILGGKRLTGDDHAHSSTHRRTSSAA